jgi:hypothetical protein
MAFLFQDQNQGIRNDAPRGNAAVATVLFHPDFNRRLRNRTESAVPFSQEHDPEKWEPVFRKDRAQTRSGKKALAGLGYLTLTAGGDFHPALRTSAARYERPIPIMANGWGASKHLHHGNLHVPMPKALLQAKPGLAEIND